MEELKSRRNKFDPTRRDDEIYSTDPSDGDTGFEGFPSPTHSTVLVQVKAVTCLEERKRTTGPHLDFYKLFQGKTSSNSSCGNEEIKAATAAPVNQLRGELSEDYMNTVNLKTSADQRTKSNSNNSKKFKSLQRSSRYQIRCSSDTSDFPVSSPSNQQDASGRRLRSIFQNNSAPANTFERNIALLNEKNPQMTLEEKINIWRCDMDFSDIEDVDNFDNLFKEHEDQKRMIDKNVKEVESQYDFIKFRANVIKNNRELPLILGNQRTTGYRTQKRLRMAMENNKNKNFLCERPRRRDSTTTTAGSSTESEVWKEYKQKPPKNYTKSFAVRDCNKHVLKRNGSEIGGQRSPDLKETIVRPKEKPVDNSETNLMLSKLSSMSFDKPFTKNDSIFKIHYHDRKVDENTENPQCLIQMRQDFTNEKKTLHLQEKKNELFKTPRCPEKCVSTLTTRNGDSSTDTFEKPEDKFNSSNLISGKGLETNNSVSPTSTTTFHQQHEFCNYLGLTGMSTANAVANAVAELAKCSIARRSLRVQTLQHQEKKYKDDQRKKIGFCEVNYKLKSSLSEKRKFNKDTTKAAVESKKDSEIKILCHISADEAKISNHSAKKISAPKPKKSLPRSRSSNSMSILPHNAAIGINYLDENCISTTQIRKVTDTECTASLISNKSNEAAIGKQNIQTKFQEFLEASRKIKPSIYIVQSLNSTDIEQNINKKKEPILAEISSSGQEKHLCAEQIHSEYRKKNQISGLNKQKKYSKKLLLLKKRKREERMHKYIMQSVWRKRLQRSIRNRKILLFRDFKKLTDTNKVKGKRLRKTVSEKIDSSLQNEESYVEKPSETLTEGINIEISDIFQLQHQTEFNCSNNNNHISPFLEDRSMEMVDRPFPSDANISFDEKDENSVIIQQDALSNEVSESKCHIFLNNESETVVVSSTTNSYDEATLLSANIIQLPHEPIEIKFNTSYKNLTKDNTTPSGSSRKGIQYLSTPAKAPLSPIKNDNGRVDYIYFEMDILIVIQEFTVSFWKHFKLISVLATPQSNCELSHQLAVSTQPEPSSSTTTITKDETSAAVTNSEWICLGKCRRLTNDIEIPSPYANRICTHNSIPIYVEMRCRELPKEQRECNLLSIYINIYYFNDDEILAKMHSIQLDTVQSISTGVVYTTLTESRYFVMTWPQENILGKTRSGLCKYSLTPNLDTLASIREFKNMRHTIRYLECLSDDKLLGFGDTQLTIWNHRSGDVLMNYNLDIELGRNLGSTYYPNLEIGQNSTLLLFQYKQNLDKDFKAQSELLTIACSISHLNPSYRILRRYNLPSPSFNRIKNATNVGDHLIITAQNDEEIWLNCVDAYTMAHLPPQNTRRFYTKGRTQLIELTNETLMIDSFTNHILKIAANVDTE